MERMANYHSSKNLGEIQMGSRKSLPDFSLNIDGVKGLFAIRA